MKKRTDLLINEITYFIQTVNLKEYTDDLKIRIYVDQDDLLIARNRKKCHLAIAERNDGNICWFLDDTLNLSYYEKRQVKEIIDLIIRYFL